MVSGVRWRGGLLGFWVRLGDEFGEVLEEFLVLVCSGTKGKEMRIFSEEMGRVLSVFSGWGSAKKKVGLWAMQGCALLVPTAGFGWLLICRFSGCN